MADTRIKISSITENQLPVFVKEEFPLVAELLSQYYLSLEGQGSSLDIFQNIDQYVKIDNLTNLVDSTTLKKDIDFFDDVIFVSSTYGFPESYGLIQIDSEIITYTGITANSFTGCIRGFSGTTLYENTGKRDELIFSSSESSIHKSVVNGTSTKVNNLSILFLKQFFKKIKKQVLPGFENRTIDSRINENLFLKQARDFYSSKGTDDSFNILFKALYGESVSVVKPRDYLFIPSNAQYRVTKDLVVEALEGNPENLVNRTLFQDQTDYFPASTGSINAVQKISRGEKDYYVLSLDYDYNKDINVRGSVFGEFSIHPQTKLITKANIGETTLDVDSTVGFPTSGTLIVNHENGSSSTVKYKSKSLTQFFECSGIDQTIKSKQNLRLDAYAYGYSGLDTSNVVKVRITGVLSNLSLPESFYYKSGDFIDIKSPGVALKEKSANNWFFNIATSFEIFSIEIQNNVNFLYKITTFDDHNFVVGDLAKITSSNGLDKSCLISSVLNSKSFIVEQSGELEIIDNCQYIIEKYISKVNSSNYPNLNNYGTNVQNVYSDGSSLFVASPSFPTYLNQPIKIDDRSRRFSGSFNNSIDISIQNHGFYTGDCVFYRSLDLSDTLNLSEETYFIKKIDDNTIRLSKSRSNIYKNSYVSITGSTLNGLLEYNSFSGKKVQPQKLIRKISSPITNKEEYQTSPGFTGILINGVEILNYKSKDSVFYGPIENISVISEGSDYDLINPPSLKVTDLSGVGVSCYCEVEGSLDRIDILDTGFDYIDEPVITITGGNGSGAIARPNMSSVDHLVEFNSTSSNFVNLSTNTITFSSEHKFRNGESIVYKTYGQTSVGGLSTDSIYYASVQNKNTVKLHKTYSDSILSVNAIDLNSYGNGSHGLLCTNLKKVIKSISIISSGSGYKNRKTSVTSSGINTASDIITIKNHKYNSGEILSYTPGIIPIGGLSQGSYYVTKVDDNNFKLSQIGVGTDNLDFYYKNNQYISFTSKGSGLHSFNYPEIQVSISGRIGVSTFSNQNFTASLQPIFRGKIKSVFVENGGVGYGASEILNYNRQPSYVLNSGSGAELSAVISDGKISDVIVLNSGKDYNSPPKIDVFGSGEGAVLVPIISDGKIQEVKIVSGGIGYLGNDTKVSITSSGRNGKLYFTPKIWNVNIFERLLQNNQVVDDDGVISNGTNLDFGLQYSHLYSPRSLRKSVLGTKKIEGEVVYIPDLIVENGKETLSDAHSPIIGWAYDGNPIYGPYGYSSITGGQIRLMKSGYLNVSSTLTDRPNPLSSEGKPLYSEGFFVEDYSYQKAGDLDEHNGRFCITPEYPNGIYAYFTTINPNDLESDLPFRGYRKPQFPYFIGNKFRSNPIDYNFNKHSNQDNIDFKNISLSRNVSPYNLDKNKSFYKFIDDPNKIKKQNLEITKTSLGKVDFVDVLSGGSDYKVGDLVQFDNKGTNGKNAVSKVSSIEGKKIQSVLTENTLFSDIEFVPNKKGSSFIGFTSLPHTIKNNDFVSISGISTNGMSISQFVRVGVQSNTYSLISGISSVSTTGIITYFSVNGTLDYPNIRENDILQIESELVKVLNVDKRNSRIRVQRQYNNTSGFSHSASTIITENTRKFTVDANLISDNYDSYNYTREIYFNPKESVGVGTSFGVGIGSIITFSNPGVGITHIFIPTKSIYLPDHNLNTGDEIVYRTNGSSAVSISTNGVGISSLTNNQVLYVAKVSSDLIQIATSKVGLGSTGNFVGIDSSISVNTLYFTGIGTGINHSFVTNPNKILKGIVNRNITTVSTASTHGLSKSDYIYFEVNTGITTTIVIKYDDNNRRMVVNPLLFTEYDINVQENTIQIVDHDFINGQKIIYTSSSPVGGLENKKIYYVHVYSKDKIKLCYTFLDSTSLNPNSINITSVGNGIISKVNPEINLEKNQTVLFDLSDPSLSFTDNSVLYSAFDFNLYLDSSFRIPFYSSSVSNKFEVSKNGVIGISSDAHLKLRITDDLPKNLYYSLDPINLDKNTEIKTEIITDKESIQSNRLNFIKNPLEGDYILSGIGTTTFTFSIKSKPKNLLYTSKDGTFKYKTTSKTASGAISEIKVSSQGSRYETLPGISSIFSEYGSGAILLPRSTSIGSVLKVNIHDIGFDYFSDKTLEPQVQFPQILRIEPFSKLKRIGISSNGSNYLVAPNLVLLDGLTGQNILDIDLRYNLGDSEIKIIKNTNSLNYITPTLVPINNSNGIPISSISFNKITKNVTVSLGVSFSSIADFPFAIGDKVLIENISVIQQEDVEVKGYNSSNYNYSLFTLTQVNPSVGGSNASLTYNLSEYLSNEDIVGSYDQSNSYGRVIPSKYFPIFDISLEKNTFFDSEFLVSDSSFGYCNSWDQKNGYLKVSSPKEFKVGEIIVGKSSGAKGSIVDAQITQSMFLVESSSIVEKGWQTETGFLNNNFQRIFDNDYYQFFSYEIKSKIQYEDWKDAVSSLNHSIGFKKFANLIVESPLTVGIQTSQDSGNFVSICDFVSVVDFNCINDFDLAFEKTISIDSKIYSDSIILQSKSIQDYTESIGNRVLTIDNISNLFTNESRSERFSIVDEYSFYSSRSKKYIIFIFDRRNTNKRQMLLVSSLSSNSSIFLNQYGRVETLEDLGYFDADMFGLGGRLLFYPTDYEFNNYYINAIAYSLSDSISGIGTLNLGDTATVSSSKKTLPQGTNTSQNIVGIASTYRASKLLVLYSSYDESYFEYDEITVLHDGSNVELLEYGQLSTDTTGTLGSSGLGTYSASLSGSNLNINFTPNVGLGVTYILNTVQISIANTSSTGISTLALSTGLLDSRITNIPSNPTPVKNVVSEYLNPHSGSYCFISIEDTTNKQYQVSEIILVNDKSSASMTEFAVLTTNSILGNFDVSTTGQKTQLNFTPIANADIQVRVYQNALKVKNEESLVNFKSLENAFIECEFASYEGTNIDLRRDFELKHKNLPIFKRNFVGSSTSVIDTINNIIIIPNHFFTNGEEVVYNSDSISTEKSIGIVTESVPGIGLTNKLPKSVYVIKVDNSTIRLASSAENALKRRPSPLIISSVGIGSTHSLTSKNQNSKVLIGIDNIIQSPIVSTAVTTSIISQVYTTTEEISVSGITSFFNEDLIKIDDEMMKIDTVGFGSTNVLYVRRGWMGTGISTHLPGSLVTKLSGSYNITESTINFAEAPRGFDPIGTTTKGPNEVDYIGISTSYSFSGRSFMRSGEIDSTDDAYSKNYILDDISDQFTGYTTSFVLKSNGLDVPNITNDNGIILINQVFQSPKRLDSAINLTGDYYLKGDVGITSINFTGSISSTSYDVNTSSIPSGGILVSVGSSMGLGYQPLVAAGGTAIISGFGTISSISIGNSGSGYRSGLQVVNVGVKTESINSPNIKYIGIASVSNGNIVSVAITNPGIGYTSSNPPIVVFDYPLSYSNIPLVYSSSSPVSGFGTGATVNILVGLGSSIVDFELTNLGYGYGQGEILTIGIGGSVGIPTDTLSAFNEFTLSVDRTAIDSFSGWSLGSLLSIDPLDSLFDGQTTLFPITVDGIPQSIRARRGSDIDIQSTLLVFINDILQSPGNGYIFNGGSYITFTEPPKVGDTSKILFYQGTYSVDIINVDILETIKVGDSVTLYDQNIAYEESDRSVTNIRSSDSVNTNIYPGPGINKDQNYLRSLNWCKQTEDKLIDNNPIPKDRPIYEPQIYPRTNLIQSVGVGSTVIFVESVKTFFNNLKENSTKQNSIVIISQDSTVGASATAIVSSAGTVTSVSITNSGIGYTVAPSVTIANPVGLGFTQRSVAISSITSGKVTSITVTSPGTGYTFTNPPLVLIETPKVSSNIEEISSVVYSGDFGIISGISTVSVGGASTGIVFDLVIPKDSFLRDSSVVGSAVTVSGIQTGYYFVVYNSNVGKGVTSLNGNGSIVGVGTSFLDNIYQVSSVSIAKTDVVGFGSTYAARVTVSVDNYNGLTGIGYSRFFGEYSWGRIYTPSRPDPKDFSSYNTGISGVSSSPLVIRKNPLKYFNYT